MPILAYNLDLDLWECLPIAVSSAVGLCFVNCIPSGLVKPMTSRSERVATPHRGCPKSGGHYLLLNGLSYSLFA
jgi:hypothetical protein